MKAELFREINGRFPLNELGKSIFQYINSNGTGRVQPIAILKKVKNSALRYFYVNVEKNTSLDTTGYVRTRQML